jgi:hypothetical protein
MAMEAEDNATAAMKEAMQSGKLKLQRLSDGPMLRWQLRGVALSASQLVLTGPKGVETIELARIEKCERMGKKVVLRRKQSGQKEEEASAGAAEEGKEQEGGESVKEAEGEQETGGNEQQQKIETERAVAEPPDLLHLRAQHVAQAECWAAAISNALQTVGRDGTAVQEPPAQEPTAVEEYRSLLEDVEVNTEKCELKVLEWCGKPKLVGREGSLLTRHGDGSSGDGWVKGRFQLVANMVRIGNVSKLPHHAEQAKPQFEVVLEADCTVEDVGGKGELQWVVRWPRWRLELRLSAPTVEEKGAWVEALKKGIELAQEARKVAVENEAKKTLAWALTVRVSRIYPKGLAEMAALLEMGSDVDTLVNTYGTLVAKCLYRGYSTEGAYLCLKYGADLNIPSPVYGFTALHSACNSGTVTPSVVQLLLTFGADPDMGIVGSGWEENHLPEGATTLRCCSSTATKATPTKTTIEPPG